MEVVSFDQPTERNGVTVDQPLDVLAFARAINELLVLASLEDAPKHGYQIALELEERSRGMFVLQHGTLYPVLHRLEKAKLVRGSWQGKGGRRRRVYALTEAGKARLAEDAERTNDVLRGLLRMVGRRSA